MRPGNIRTLQRAAVRAFPRTDYTPRHTTRSLRIKWLRAVHTLGPAWRGLPIKPVPNQ